MKDLQERFKSVEYILVDEMSMVGQDMLGLMSIRGRQAVAGRTADGNDGRGRGLFGGLSVILVGDPMQLPPVGSAPMWGEKPGTAGHTVEGRAAWLGLNAGVELTEVMRQAGDAQAAFRRALLAVAEGRALKEHFDLLATRMRSQVPEAEQATFHDAVHLFPTNVEAEDWNWERLNILGTAIALVVASHSVGGYTNVTAERFRNLEPHLYLAVGARVFINNNVWTAAGLANGAAGEIVHMEWGSDSGGERPSALPSVVFVRVHNFRGRQFFTEPSAVVNGEIIDLRNVVPIVAMESQDEMGPAANATGTVRARCYRSQLPVKLAFGVTHHKSQGATLDRVVLDIGKREINDGQTFTALSRCRDLTNMLLEDFTQERLQAIGRSSSFPARLAALDRIRSLEDQTRLKFGLPVLMREPRPPRPTATAARRGGRGRGRPGGLGSGRGRGRDSGRTTGRASGRVSASATGRNGRGPGTGPGRPLLLPQTATWEAYALSEIERAQTNSWFYVPLLLDAFDVQRAVMFLRPLHWDVFVECYRVKFADNNIRRRSYITSRNNTTYISRHKQTFLLNLHQQAGQFIVHWINAFRNTRDASVPLPDANFEH